MALQRLDFLAGIQLVDMHHAIRTPDDRLPAITGHSDAIDHFRRPREGPRFLLGSQVPVPQLTVIAAEQDMPAILGQSHTQDRNA